MAETDQTTDTGTDAEGTQEEGSENASGKPDTGAKGDESGGKDEGTESGGDWTPPTKDEHDRMKSALAARKTENNRLKAELKAAKESGDKPDPAAEADLRLKRSATRSALEGAGLTREGAKAALKIVNLDALELDEDGDVDAADLLELIRSSFAPLFKSNGGKPTPGKPVSAKKPGAGDDGKKSAARRLLESAGY